MAELRWILLALGVMLIAGIYLWGRGLFGRRSQRRSRRRRRSEPRIASDGEPVSEDVLFARPGDESAVPPMRRETVDDDLATGDTAAIETPPQEAHAAPPEPRVEKIVALRFVSRSAELDATAAVQAMRDAGLEHGRYGIFHCLDASFPDDPLFSVASLTEPGSFDLERLAEQPLSGMSFFMLLPGPGDPVERFDTMVETARALAHRLDAELLDDRGSSWSIQRERYIREELIHYRLQAAPS